MLLDDTSNRASDAGYQPGDNLRNSYRPVDPQDDEQSYPSMNEGQEIDPETESYPSQNQANFTDPAFQDAKKQQEKRRLIDEAKRLMNRGQATVQRTIPKKIGEALGDKHMFKDDSEAGREQAREFAKQKARDYAKEKIGKHIADAGIKKGFEKGLSKGAGSLAKEGAQKAVGKAAGKLAGEAAAKAGTKVGAQAATKGLQAAVTAGGAATGVETFGLGFLLSFLLNIAISLGVSDAVDALFELKDGNVKHATFLAIRAATKIGIFLWLLICLVTIFSVGGIIFGVPILIGLNIYMILGIIPAFKGIPQLQGMVWWERVIIIMIDIIAFLILMAFLGALGWYLCQTTGLGSGGVQGTILQGIITVYDWWNQSSAGTVAADFCKYVNGQ